MTSKNAKSSVVLHLISHSEHSDLLLSLRSGLLQLSLGMMELALQSVASCLQVADLGFALLQGQGQLCHLMFDLQLLFLMLQPNLHRQTEIGDRVR